MTTMNQEALNNIIKSAESPVLVTYKAVWCRPCSMLKGVIEEVQSEKLADFILLAIDADENMDMAASAGVRGVPTSFLYSGGNLINTKVGVMSKKQLVDFINTAKGAV